MIFDCINISKSFADNEILKNASFRMENNQKTALVGPNGCGKTTLLRMICKELDTDEGSIIVPGNINIGYLTQNPNLNTELSIYDEVLSTRLDLLKTEEEMRSVEKEMNCASTVDINRLLNKYSVLNERYEREGGYAYKSRVVGVLKGMGFREEDFLKKGAVLSGGEKTRIALGKLLLKELDLLILDEPTNHLDIEAIKWLETYLSNYPKALLLVSHDRYFLNKIVSSVIEIDQGQIKCYKGNYDEYSVKKVELIKAAVKAYNNQQNLIKKQEKVIETLKSFNREKSVKRAESREKMLNKIERIEKPDDYTEQMRINFTPSTESGRDVLFTENVSKSFDNRLLFDNVNLNIYRGDKIALIGDNGAGKTTLIKILLNQIECDKGHIKFGTNVKIAYFDQEHAVLDKNKTIFEEISDSYPDMTETRIRNVMASFLFVEDQVFSKIELLSGGEQGRVALAKLMLSDANFLILDEPTNHLDIMSKEILEEAINHYKGTVLYISHDRYFINKTCNRLLYLNNRRITVFTGNYDEFIEKSDLNGIIEEKTEEGDTASVSKEEWQKKKEALSIKRKKENEINRIQTSLNEIEIRKNEINALLEDNSIAEDYIKVTELSKELELLSEDEEGLFERWSLLSD